MDLRSLDLNLLVVFDVLMRLRSVTRTADALGLSQSATSGALARLRQALDDALFVRTGAQMEPTPRAMLLAPVVGRLLETVRTEVLQPPGFEPGRVSRAFTILTPDIGEVAFLPGVLRRLRDEAPGVRLQTLTRTRDQAAMAIESGAADLAVGFFPDLQKTGFFQQALFVTDYACITCAGNDGLDERPSLRQYLAARHVVVHPDGREHLLDRYLDGKGWQRQTTLVLSHFMSLLALLPGSDLVATVPRDIATVVGRHVPLREVVLPFRGPRLQIRQYWHRRVHDDLANRWLRGVFHAVNRRDRGAAMPT